MTPRAAAAPSTPPEAGDSTTTTRILDAAQELFEDVGIRKSTLEDIARRAGVDRVTVYRRLGSKNDVAQAVIARDAARIFERVAAETEEKEDLGDRVVAAFTGLMVALRDHTLFNRLVRLEPDETLPKVTTHASDMLAMGIHWAAQTIAPPHADAADLADLTARIEISARFIHSTMLTKHGVVDLSSEKQLTEFARTYIVPIIVGPTSSRD